ncbi:hypothetical protein [Nocardioides sp.]|uniref:hypothetical protein n=1 Tax=Nocardioides sp. TaxID=35761 RepID=UPI003519942A
MTPAEAAVLLGMAATVDNRKPDEDAARAWAAMLDGLRFDDCRVAIIEHYRESSDWLTPEKVRTRVLAIRKRRRLEHKRQYGELVPPPGLTNAEEHVWLRDAVRAISNGERVDCAAAHPEPVAAPQHLRELIARATPDLTRQETDA